MTTATAPRTIATDDRRYAIIANTTISVITGTHDYEDGRRISVNHYDDTVSISASDPMDHATFYISREEARLLAQAILDATA